MFDAREPVSLDEYVRTSYEPDAEFVDGALVRRNAGSPAHGWLQLRVGAYFERFRQTHKLTGFIAVRLLIDSSPVRYRVPDIAVVERPYRDGKFLVDVPAIVVEVTSPEDTFDDVIDRCLDYEQLGVSEHSRYGSE